MTQSQTYAVPNPLSILLVDDDEADRKLMRRALKQAGLPYRCVEAATIDDALAACNDDVFDCAIVDYRLPGSDGVQGIAVLHERLPRMAIIMVTGAGDEMVATEAMKRGASDYTTKAGVNAESIRRIVEGAMEKTALREKAAQQRKELESFAHVLAHDLSAPIASIQIFAQAIEEDIDRARGDRSEIVDHCREVVKAGQRAGALIDSLHDYTRMDARPALAPVDMLQAMKDALSNLNHAILKRGAIVTHDGLPVVTGNAPQLGQLLQNLIGNALKYCEFPVPRVHVTASPDGQDVWRFSVSDNGIGIPAADRERIFEPFTRLHGVDTYGGTGLGLATCKKIVERHGGRIWCEPGPAGGTAFLFTLRGVRT